MMLSVTNESLWILYRNSQFFLSFFTNHESLTQAILLMVQNSLSIVIVYLFTGTRSLHNFLIQTGLCSKPTFYGWLAAWGAFCLAVFALYAVTRRLIPQNSISHIFYTQGGIAKWFFIIFAVFVAPICEEVVRRGFLYCAFRKSFGPWLGTICILCLNIYFHWGLISRSYYTFGCIILVEASLCLLRERTGSLWNCILFHSTYNITQSLPFYYSPLILLIVLFYFLYCRRFKNIMAIAKDN